MNWHFNLASFSVVISAIFAVVLAIFSWRRRATNPWIIYFTLLAIAIAEWSLGYAFELAALKLPAKIIWAKIQYLGIVTTPLAWFLFAILYSGKEKWVNRRNVILLAIIPVITLLFVFTNELHNLVWTGFALDDSGSLLILAVDYGWWFWIHSTYSYILIMLGAIILFQAIRRFPAIYLWQIRIMLLAPIVPLLGNGIYLSGLSPVPQLDLTPSAFTISALLFAWGIFRSQLFHIGPVARRTVIDNMGDSMFVLDLENHIVDANPAAAVILGQEPANVIGQSIGPFLNQRPDLVSQYGRIHEGDGEIVLNLDNQQRWYDLRISPLRDARQNLRGRVLVLRNITDRKRVETLLAQRNQILQTLHQLSQEIASTLDLQTLLNTAAKSATEALQVTSAYINDWDEEYGTTTVLAEYYAPTASALEQVSDLGVTYSLKGDFGWPVEWIHSPHNNYVTHIDDDDISEEERAHMAKYDGKTVLEVPLRAKSKPLGTLELWESRSKRAFTKEEITLVLEIAQQVALAMENAYLYEHALAANQLKSRILARVSHELRTPLSVIKLYAEMMRYSPKYTSSPENQQEALDKIITSAEDLVVIINDLLDQSTLEAGKLTLKVTSFAPAKILDKVHNQMDLLTKSKGLLLTTQIEADMPRYVSGDPDRVQQVLVNLIGNAIKFTEAGEIAVKFCLYGTHHWAMVVSDTGPGIPQETQGFIFDPFHQGDISKDWTRAGIGLGLSIVKHLTDLMGGQITLESEVGQGSTFTVIFPLREA